MSCSKPRDSSELSFVKLVSWINLSTALRKKQTRLEQYVGGAI